MYVIHDKIGVDVFMTAITAVAVLLVSEIFEN